MKHGKRPTRRQKVLMQRRKLDPNLWLVNKDMPNALHIEHRITGVRRIMPKGGVA
ncbi:DUF6906 family protein [Desulforamulus aquiferis]|uniref:DUF6906 domain-containing protein n=1 Tax=Desulforamulus aquiferis TaxID=1397668 RepID=A0AAW7ZMS4_9FIRM|nr:hypothetical protein [Desulforamulus aquiferis]MDO7789135.1 hypothetical protein [Desulforamulus aquiferis]